MLRAARSPQSTSRVSALRPALLLAVLVAAGGCSRALFPANESRSQFDRYDRARNQYAPQFVLDEFGRRTPNLDGRLSPR